MTPPRPLLFTEKGALHHDLGRQAFTWGSGAIVRAGAFRCSYIDALRVLPVDTYSITYQIYPIGTICLASQ
jgi:hypothetical protein